MKTEAENWVMLPQAKECLELGDVRREAKNGISPRASRTNIPSPQFDCMLLASRIVREYILVVLSHSNCGDLLQLP